VHVLPLYSLTCSLKRLALRTRPKRKGETATSRLRRRHLQQLVRLLSLARVSLEGSLVVTRSAHPILVRTFDLIALVGKRRDSISRSPESELPKPVSFDISPDAPPLPSLSPRSTKGHSLLPIRSRSSKRGLARNPSSSSQLGIEQTVAQSSPRSPSSPPSSSSTNAARPISRQLTPSAVTNSFADVHTKASVRGPRSPPRPAVAAPPVSRTISSSRRTSGSSLDRPTPPSSSSSVSSNLPGGPSQFASSHAPDLSNPCVLIRFWRDRLLCSSLFLDPHPCFVPCFV
jgi:hypothetical protein